MYRSQYDTDVTTFSPAGRLHQVEYAIEAVKQGSATVGVRSNTHAVIVSLKRTASELASYQEKVFKIDKFIGVSVSGLIADARVLSKFMHSEALNHRFVFNSSIQVARLVQSVADKSQVFTQKATKRPYGVGLLVVGYDKTGPHLFETCPSGNYMEYHAQAIGSRSQSARTYLERQYEQFGNCSLDQLIKHALTALRGTLHSGDLNEKNVSIGIVGKDQPFTVLSSEEARRFTTEVESQYKEEKKQENDEDEDDEDAPAAAAAAADAEDAQALGQQMQQ